MKDVRECKSYPDGDPVGFWDQLPSSPNVFLPSTVQVIPTWKAFGEEKPNKKPLPKCIFDDPIRYHNWKVALIRDINKHKEQLYRLQDVIACLSPEEEDKLKNLLLCLKIQEIHLKIEEERREEERPLWVYKSKPLSVLSKNGRLLAIGKKAQVMAKLVFYQ